MHPGFMNHTAVAFVGGALCSALLACVVHDDTTFPNLPQPGQTATSTRIVVNSGVVTLSGDDGGGGGGAGELTPDARVLSDSSPDVATIEIGGIGSVCDPFGTNNSALCGTGKGCYPNPADGSASCQAQGLRSLPAGSQCTPTTDPTALGCGPQLICGSSLVCANLCHYTGGTTVTAECGASIGGQCLKLGTSPTVGYCN